jgi:hypothetical protein
MQSRCFQQPPGCTKSGRVHRKPIEGKPSPGLVTVDLCGLGGPGGPGNCSQRWPRPPSTFCNGLLWPSRPPRPQTSSVSRSGFGFSVFGFIRLKMINQNGPIRSHLGSSLPCFQDHRGSTLPDAPPARTSRSKSNTPLGRSNHDKSAPPNPSIFYRFLVIFLRLFYVGSTRRAKWRGPGCGGRRFSAEVGSVLIVFAHPRRARRAKGRGPGRRVRRFSVDF